MRFDSYGEEAVDALATPKKNGAIHFQETDKTLIIKFVTDCTLLILCDKLGVWDSDGESTCEIKDRSSCKLRTYMIYEAVEPLKEKFDFLNDSEAEVEKKIKRIRGLFDLFADDEMFSLGFYVGYGLMREVFSTKIFGKGCYSDCSLNGFKQLSRFRQAIFQTRDVYFGGLIKSKSESPL